MDKIFGLVLLVLVGGSALLAMLATIALLFPSQVERTREVIATSFLRSFLLGLVNFLFFGAIAALLVKLGQGAGGPVAAALTLLALLLLLALTIFSVLGLAALLIIQRYPEWVGLPRQDVHLQQAPSYGVLQQGPVSYAEAVGNAAPAVISALVRRKSRREMPSRCSSASTLS